MLTEFCHLSARKKNPRIFYYFLPKEKKLNEHARSRSIKYVCAYVHIFKMREIVS